MTSIAINGRKQTIIQDSLSMCLRSGRIITIISIEVPVPGSPPRWLPGPSKGILRRGLGPVSPLLLARFSLHILLTLFGSTGFGRMGAKHIEPFLEANTFWFVKLKQRHLRNPGMIRFPCKMPTHVVVSTMVSFRGARFADFDLNHPQWRAQTEKFPCLLGFQPGFYFQTTQKEPPWT